MLYIKKNIKIKVYIKKISISLYKSGNNFEIRILNVKIIIIIIQIIIYVKNCINIIMSNFELK